MEEADYMKVRVEAQRAWYSKKSSLNKKYHYRFNAAILICSALIPFLSGYENLNLSPLLSGEIPSSWVVGLLGVSAASLTGITALVKFQDKWTTYRAAAEALTREKMLYDTATYPYDKGGNNFNLFVRNIEEILGNENKGWVQFTGVGEQQEQQ
ncbi:Protein of unknown function [Robiginitalea myxolifaciens]|uniref:SMODS and SLOG-associating 2TM effector domain-containing protein n=1 Tax=Robiginitalea myxolifaciens TaxID=400055 RepID=A0A1I6FW58_9FLAO|nr:DUF4231 domain-containing protein [Robiginitalea myxolifaciens]SFR34169.1 Protein of unknown function [Robiginitalea myxolifaciens]